MTGKSEEEDEGKEGEDAGVRVRVRVRVTTRYTPAILLFCPPSANWPSADHHGMIILFEVCLTYT